MSTPKWALITGITGQDGSYLTLGLLGVHRTGIGEDGFFAGRVRFALRLVITRRAIHLQITVEQVIGNMLNLVKDTALVRHPIEMV
jgi:GDP-D-mannose dehydratase